MTQGPKVICSTCGHGPVLCPCCGGANLTGVRTRNTNNGFKNAQNLVFWLNTQTKYRAESEPKANKHRPSGSVLRPDIKVWDPNGRVGQPFIYVERQEQNVPGTGSEKIANKLQKALNTVRDLNVKMFYVVIAGKRADLLKRVADDSHKSGTYQHERVLVIHEDDFKARALAGGL